MSKEVPRVELIGNDVVITFTADGLQWVAENDPSNSYKINDLEKFMKAVRFQFENYQTQNSQEIGLTALQELTDRIIEEVYVNDGEDCITDKTKTQ